MVSEVTREKASFVGRLAYDGGIRRLPRQCYLVCETFAALLLFARRIDLKLLLPAGL